jgi:hypothetical protein
MLFLLRLVFWIMLILLLLPGSREDNRRLISSAERTVSDVQGFCQRNPGVCEDARITLASMLSRLRSGAEFVQAWLSQGGKLNKERIADTPDRYISPGAQREEQPQYQGDPPAPIRPTPKWQDSLNPADKQVPWHGPSRL